MRLVATIDLPDYPEVSAAEARDAVYARLADEAGYVDGDALEPSAVTVEVVVVDVGRPTTSKACAKCGATYDGAPGADYCPPCHDAFWKARAEIERPTGFPYEEDARAMLRLVADGKLRALARLDLNEILLVVVEAEDGTGVCLWSDGPRADAGYYETAVDALRAFAVDLERRTSGMLPGEDI